MFFIAEYDHNGLIYLDNDHLDEPFTNRADAELAFNDLAAADPNGHYEILAA